MFRLHYITDTHIGARAVDEKKLRKDIAAIAADPNALWIHGGDVIDCIARKGDKRYNEETLAPWLWGQNDVVGTQTDYALELFRPIADKCIGIVCGNHERAALDWYDRDIYAYFVHHYAALGHQKPHELALGVQGFIRLAFRRGTTLSSGDGWNLDLYCHHGFGGGSLPGGHALALGRVLGNYNCDLAFMGHRHVRQFVDKTVVGIVGQKVVHTYRAAHFVASYLNSYILPSNEAKPVDTYAEAKGLPDLPIGETAVLIDPDERMFHSIISNNPSAVLAGNFSRADIAS